MNYIEAPNFIETNKQSLFLAGGISNCPPWQNELLRSLDNLDIAVFNPRRKIFPNDKDVNLHQITWEFTYLRRASVISFWFCRETLCPITLLELGSWLMTNKPLIIGMNPEYQRRTDVEIQTKLARPEIQIVYSLKELLLQIYMNFR
jgi:Nucleoside 2-deoxyribosyltransferase like